MSNDDLVACCFSDQLSSPQYFHQLFLFSSEKKKTHHHETPISSGRPHPAINNDTTTSSTTKNCWVDNNTFGNGEAIAFSCCWFRIRFWVWIAVCCLVAGECAIMCMLLSLLNIIVTGLRAIIIACCNHLVAFKFIIWPLSNIICNVYHPIWFPSFFFLWKRSMFQMTCTYVTAYTK